MEDIRARLDTIRSRIERAARSAGRDPATIELVAVSKLHDISAIQSAYDLGLRHFGESRWQEAQGKIEALPTDIVWHYIGRLQSSKARRIATAFNVLHALDSSVQLQAIKNQNNVLDGFIQVNLAKEPQKSGIFLEGLDKFSQVVLECSQVNLRGLMTIGPYGDDPEESRRYFRTLRLAAEALGLSQLSMGMSHDLEVAIQEGSTHVRVGTALFGSRV